MWKELLPRWTENLSARLCVRSSPRGQRLAAVRPAATEGAMKKQYSVLFLCTGNSARSIMAEAIMNSKGRPQFQAYSAGSHPTGKVRPEALRQLELARLATSGLHSKSWDEFARAGAPQLDFVFTVCDNAANE